MHACAPGWELFSGFLSWNSSLKTMLVCMCVITQFTADFLQMQRPDLISLMTKTSSPRWSQRQLCTVTLRRSWKGSGLIKRNILMQWGILRSVQWDVPLIRVAVYLLVDRAKVYLCKCGHWCAVSLLSTLNMICHLLFIHLTFTLLFCRIALMRTASVCL